MTLATTSVVTPTSWLAHDQVKLEPVDTRPWPCAYAQGGTTDSLERGLDGAIANQDSASAASQDLFLRMGNLPRNKGTSTSILANMD